MRFFFDMTISLFFFTEPITVNTMATIMAIETISRIIPETRNIFPSVVQAVVFNIITEIYVNFNRKTKFVASIAKYKSICYNCNIVVYEGRL